MSGFRGLTLADIDRDDRVGDLFVEALLHRITGRDNCHGARQSIRSVAHPAGDGTLVKLDADPDSTRTYGHSWPAPPRDLRIRRLVEAKKRYYARQ